MAAKLSIAAQTEALLLSPVWGFTPGVAVGCFSDLAGARSRMVREIGGFRPRADLHAAYQEIYRRYRQVYEAVRPLV